VPPDCTQVDKGVTGRLRVMNRNLHVTDHSEIFAVFALTPFIATLCSFPTQNAVVKFPYISSMQLYSC